MRFRRAALLALLPALCAAAPAPPSPALWAGVWFGTGQPDDKSEMYIDYFQAGGAFHNHHRWCRQGKAEDLSETGHWTLEGDALTVRIETTDGRSAPRLDAYRALSVDAKTQKYIFLPTNFTYTAHRVAAGFEMPPCDLTS
jgi:hypothetical protein